eukprot:223398_1
MSRSFEQHMSFLEAHKLNIGEKVDHRDLYGHWALATIIDKAHDRSGMLQLHYDGLSAQYDTECSYINELHRFALPGSISRRAAHRLRSIKVGSLVDINTMQHPGWRKAEVVACSQRSGQIQVQYLLDISGGMMEKPMKWKRWVHLDNISEVDSFGRYTSKKDMNHLRVSLETKRAYSNICNASNDLKQCCAKQIIDRVYGGYNNILTYLINNASTSELQQIQEIIKFTLADGTCDPQDTNTNDCVPKEQRHNTNETHSANHDSLSDLSCDSISNICGFLDREDIKQFKLTSYRIGIMCLTEMTKCNVAISNINEIINDVDGKYVDELGVIYRKNYRFDRYPSNMDYLSLRKTWQQKYDIPLSKQLLVSQNERACRFYDTKKNEKMDPLKINIIPSATPCARFLLFDKRNMIKFDEKHDEAKIMNVCNEKKQCISLIKWFDIYFQEITPLQWVMGNRQSMTIARLTQYIENEFIATTAMQRAWHKKVCNYFHKMDAYKDGANTPKLVVYKEYKNKLSRFVNPNEKIAWWTVCIFQLNTAHPAFDKYKFTSIQEKYSLLQQQ